MANNFLTPAVLLGLVLFTQRPAARTSTPSRDAPKTGAWNRLTDAGTGCAHQGEHTGAVPAKDDYTETNRL